MPVSNDEIFDLDDVDVTQTTPFVVKLRHYQFNHVIEWACQAYDANVARHLGEFNNPGYLAVEASPRPGMGLDDIEAINQAA